MNPHNRADRKAKRPYFSSPTSIVLQARARAHSHVRLDREEQREWQAHQREIYGDARLGCQIGRDRVLSAHHAAVARLVALIEHHEHVGALTAADLNTPRESLPIATRPLTTSGVALRGPDTSATSITNLVTTRPALLTL